MLSLHKLLGLDLMCLPYIMDYTNIVYDLLSHVGFFSGEVLVAFCGKASSDRVVLPG